MCGCLLVCWFFFFFFFFFLRHFLSCQWTMYNVHTILFIYKRYFFSLQLSYVSYVCAVVVIFSFEFSLCVFFSPSIFLFQLFHTHMHSIASENIRTTANNSCITVQQTPEPAYGCGVCVCVHLKFDLSCFFTVSVQDI